MHSTLGMPNPYDESLDGVVWWAADASRLYAQQSYAHVASGASAISRCNGTRRDVVPLPKGGGWHSSIQSGGNRSRAWGRITVASGSRHCGYAKSRTIRG